MKRGELVLRAPSGREAILHKSGVFLNKSVHVALPDPLKSLDLVLSGCLSNSGTMLALIVKQADDDTAGNISLYNLSNRRVVRSDLGADGLDAQFTFDETRLIVMTSFYEFIIFHTCPAKLSRVTKFPWDNETPPKSFVLFQDAVSNKFFVNVTSLGEATKTLRFKQKEKWNLYEDGPEDAWISDEQTKSSDDTTNREAQDAKDEDAPKTIQQASELLQNRANMLKKWADQLYERHDALQRRAATMIRDLQALPERQRKLKERVRDLVRRMQCLIEKADVNQHGASIKSAWGRLQEANTIIRQICNDPSNSKILDEQVSEETVRELIQLRERIRALETKS